MKNRAIKLSRKPFIRNVATILTGTVAAQAITICITPIISRIYNPEAFGMLGVFNFIISIIAPIAALSYPIAIVMARNDMDAKWIGRMSLCIAAGFTLLGTLALVLGGERLAGVMSIEQITPFSHLIPVVIIGIAAQQVVQHWALRKGLFKAFGRASTLHSALVGGARTGLGLMHPSPMTLVSIAAVAPALLAAILTFLVRGGDSAPRQIPEPISDNESAQSAITRLAICFRAFPLYRTPRCLIDALTTGVPTVLLMHFDGASAAGAYVLAMQVLTLPITLVGAAVSDVFYPRFADEIRRRGNPVRMLQWATLGIAGIGLIPFAIIVMSGPMLFPLVLGEKWRQCGDYAQWLAIWLFFGLANRPVAGAIPALGLERALFLTEVVDTITRIAALLVGFLWFSNSIAAIAMYSLAGALKNLALIIGVNVITAERYASLRAPDGEETNKTNHNGCSYET